MLNGEKYQAMLKQPQIGNQKGRDQGNAKNKMLDRWGKTRFRKTGNYKLGGVGPGSCKLESIDRDGENSYRVMKPYDDDNIIHALIQSRN